MYHEDINKYQYRILCEKLQNHKIHHKWVKRFKMMFCMLMAIILYVFVGCANFDPSQALKTGIYSTVRWTTGSTDAAYFAMWGFEIMDEWGDDLGCSTDTECMEMYGGDGSPEPMIYTKILPIQQWEKDCWPHLYDLSSPMQILNEVVEADRVFGSYEASDIVGLGL